MEKQQFDFCILGAGAGGLVVANVAARLGFKVLLIENAKMGGDCLNYGCVPSKSLLAAAKHVNSCRHLNTFGLRSCEPHIDYAAIANYVQSVIRQIEPHDSVERYESLGATVIQGDAEFISRNAIMINGQEIQARYFIVATGSRAFIPPIAGLDDVPYLTNHTIFDLKEQPKRMIVIGGGPIGVEMIQAQLMLGTPVTLLSKTPILPKDDPEAVDVVRNHFIDQGLQLIERCDIECVERCELGVRVHYCVNGEKLQVDGSHLLVATGRVANVDGLSLERAGIEFDARHIKVDLRLRTSNKRIYAIGDVSGGPQFTHVAGYQAGVVIRNTIFKISAKVNYQALPWVTYTDPELAQVGMNVLMADQKHVHYQMITFALSEIDRFRAEAATDGFIKVLTDKKRRVLGVTIVGQSAGELLLPWCLAIQNKMRIDKLAALIAPYPTRSEVSKRVAGQFFESALFGKRTRRLVGWIFRLL